MNKLIKSFVLWCIKKRSLLFNSIHELKNIYRKRRIFSKVKLTEAQKREIDAFYKENYGRKVRHWWHRLYTSYTGKFDAKYIPEYIYKLWLNNDRRSIEPLVNKNLLDVLFGGGEIVVTPKTYIMKVAGRYYDGDRRPVTKEAALRIVRQISSAPLGVVLKPAVGTNAGNGVRIFDLHDGIDTTYNEDVETLLDRWGDDLVLQERIKQHPQIAMLYPHSINTIRVNTYQINDNYHVAPLSLRIGQGGRKVDNAHAGGIFVGIDADGRLRAEAYTEYQNRYTAHPDTGVVFEGHQLPRIDDIKEACIKLHQRIPMVGIVAWDICVNDRDEIVLIEANMMCPGIWLPQMANGEGMFGENTAEVLKLAGQRRRLSDWRPGSLSCT